MILKGLFFRTSDKWNLQYGVGKKICEKLFLHSPYFCEAVNVGLGINRDCQSQNAAKKNKGHFKRESVYE